MQQSPTPCKWDTCVNPSHSLDVPPLLEPAPFHSVAHGPQSAGEVTPGLKGEGHQACRGPPFRPLATNRPTNSPARRAPPSRWCPQRCGR